ncbi:beta,beta-carotene 15,15'-dioxygenase-like [Saccostrea echinata]|uniref:beta,beta-carotene 15,15'-dioxygenase-like n=1 Tax=Saccostrea echinata TaxID=191078 RepID=UPI002A82075A|nr:beta,beta-carotene 15,15'-dioxygenase-like [Saccostrea echinata]
MIRHLLFTASFVGILADLPGWNLLFGTDVLNETYKEPLTFDNPVPKWIKGSLIRNGPARYGMGKHSFRNVFDGYAKLYSWQFPGNGSAYFSSKFVQSKSYKESLSINDVAPYQTFDNLVPPRTIMEQELSLFNGMDNMNVNIYNYSGDCVILTDTWKLYVVNCYTLETIRECNPKIPGAKTSFPFLSILSVAHPLQEYGTNHHLTFLQSESMEPKVSSKFTLVRTKSADIREKIAEWNVKKMPYLHSFSTTERYAIILACPFYVNIEKILTGHLPVDSMFFDKDEPTLTYIVNIKTGKVTTIATENVYTLHHVNAYELDEDTIFMDIASYSDAAVVALLEMDTIMNETRRNAYPYKPYLKRFRIDLKAEKMTPLSFDVNPKVPHVNMLEAPTINELYRSKHYCYIYGAVFKSDFKTFGNFSFVKKDICNTTGDMSWSLPGHYPMEGWFVPDPNGSAEDDGVLMLPVLDGNLGKSYLLILDPKTMKPITKSYMPFNVPFHFHGRFIKNLF